MKFLQRIKDGAGKVTDKAQNAVEIGKLNTQINNIEREMDLYFQRMGEVFYEGYRIKDMSIAEKEMVDLAKTCDLLAEERDEIRGKIAELKNERLCGACSKTVTEEALFCQYCGHKLEKPAKQVQVHPDEEESVAKQEPVSDPLTLLEESTLFASLDQEESVVSETRERVDPEEMTRRLRELERERERQEELDRRIRTWKENVKLTDHVAATKEALRGESTCQICSAVLVKGTKWCPHCGSEQI
ncbi:zinc ribbon domain-containing protein [Paenibacillus lentus]|uniref:Zinc ribbon domain-containing protein n=1 Tax=Paenibacillus lentus TaxID=1338368 RepID=A0A3Q8S3E2_9BACL|nr:zinc ribbon domain-containing protein [Paenibacillus lentus]AZK44908.1 zinc ribbon domain-containing protein [Paenibacillus lentus]